MPRREDLYYEISRHIWKLFDNPIDKLTDALLWRGFLVEKHENEIRLCIGSHENDLSFLEKILPRPRVDIKQILGDESHRATISIPQGINEGDILNVVSSGRQPGPDMTEMKDTKMDFDAFHGRNFGERVDAQEIDIGIALMVKTLALVGVFTNSSCDGFGHGDHYPWIGLNGEYNYRWCKKVINEVNPLPQVDNLVNFTHDPKRQFPYRWEIAPHNFDRQLNEATQIFYKIHRIARHIMRPRVFEPLQALKKRMGRDDFLAP